MTQTYEPLPTTPIQFMHTDDGPQLMQRVETVADLSLLGNRNLVGASAHPTASTDTTFDSQRLRGLGVTRVQAQRVAPDAGDPTHGVYLGIDASDLIRDAMVEVVESDTGEIEYLAHTLNDLNNGAVDDDDRQIPECDLAETADEAWAAVVALGNGIGTERGVFLPVRYARALAERILLACEQAEEINAEEAS